MNTELFEKLSALEGDTQLAEAIANVKTVPEMVTLLTSHGIPVTEDDINDLLKPSDELSENSLDSVAGGCWINIGFFHGFYHGCGNETQYEKGGPLYSLGFWAGKQICHPFGW
mgnify:FL=1